MRASCALKTCAPCAISSRCCQRWTIGSRLQDWLTALVNARPYDCVLDRSTARNHGQPYQYHVTLVEQVTFSSLVS